MALTVLVTGGGGVLGRSLRGVLQKRGHRVVSCGRVPGPGVDAVWHVGGEHAPACVVKPDVVVHAAAMLAGYRQPVSSGDAAAMANVNVTGTLRVARWSVAQGVRRLVLLSSASVYGRWSEAPKRETDPVEPHAAGLYAVTKHCAEQMAQLVAAEGCELAVLRLASLYGPGYEKSLVLRMLRVAAQTRRIALRPPLDDAFDLLHVEDAANATGAAVESRRCGTWNVGSGRLTTIAELVRVCAAQCGAVVDVASGVADAPRQILNWVDDSRARAELGHQNCWTLAEGIESLTRIENDSAAA